MENNWDFRLLIKMQGALFGASMKTGLELLSECTSNALNWIETNNAANFIISHDLTLFKHVDYASLATVAIFYNQDRKKALNFAQLKKQIFYKDKLFRIGKPTFDTGINVLTECLNETKQWILDNNVELLDFSHDVNIFESFGATGVLATIVIFYQ